jgi:hypothetical protein
LFEPVQAPIAETPTIFIVEEVDEPGLDEPFNSLDDPGDETLTGF